MKPLRVLLVDENDEFLDGLSECIDSPAAYQIVGRAHSGRETLDRLVELGPDLILIDMTLPDMSGLELTRRIKSRPAPPRVVLMSFHDSAAARLVTTAAGADGLIAESDLRSQLAPLIDQLFAGYETNRS